MGQAKLSTFFQALKQVLEHQFQSLARFEYGGASDAVDIAKSGFVVSVDEEIVEIDVNLAVDELRSAVAKRVDTLCSEQLVLVPPVTWNGETGPDEVYAMANAGFVFTMYEVQCWWFEIFELSRKLILSAVIIFIVDPDIRLAVAFLISFLSLLVVFYAQPFVSPSLDRLMTFSLITQTLTLSYGLILVVQTSSKDSAASQADVRFLEIITLLLNGTLFAIPIVDMLFANVYRVLVEKVFPIEYSANNSPDISSPSGVQASQNP